MRWRARALVPGLALALAAVSAAAADPAGPLPLAPCQLRGVEHPALCGQLRRPLDPQAPDGAAFELHVAVLPALARHKKPDPVFFLAGGPGQSAIDLAGPVGRLLGRFTNRRDIVLVDQRGTGRSAPLRCDDDDKRPGTRALREGTDPALVLQQLARCRQALQRLPHGDLRRYTTTLAMQDLDAVRQALGAARINLVGASYGTRAALDYLRQFPHAVRRVVLDGVAPPDMVMPASFAVDGQAAFDALLAWCAADGACSQAHPRLATQWQGLRASLPRDVTVPHPVTGRDETLHLTPDMLAGLVRGPLYAPALAAALPLAISEAAAGRWGALAGLAMAGGGRGQQLATGMHFSVVCAEDAARLDGPRAAPSADIGAGVADLYRQACADWPRAPVPADFYRVAAAPVPVLLLSGAADPATPPRHGQRVAQALGARARHVVVAAAGHGVMGLPCLREQVFRFVDADDEAGALAVDTACVDRLPRPPLVRPPGVAP